MSSAIHPTANVDYPGAGRDKYGVLPLFLYKTGSPWPHILKGGHLIGREMRPVAPGHPIQQKWPNIIKRIVNHFNQLGMPPAVISPLAYGNRDEKETFCELLVVVGIATTGFDFERVKEAADYAQSSILADEGFPDIDVAVRKWDVQCSYAQLPSIDPLYDFDYLKPISPFTTNPGLAIASLDRPTREGTVGAYFRLPVGDRNIILGLTCSHVVSPPCNNTTSFSVDEAAARNDRIIALGSKAYESSIAAISERIAILKHDIRRRAEWVQSWNAELGGEHDDETETVSATTNDIHTRAQLLIQGLSFGLQGLQRRRKQIIATLGKPEDREIGHVYFAEPIGASEESLSAHTIDWAFIHIDEGAFGRNFSGNKVFIDESTYRFCTLMCQSVCERPYIDNHPKDSLLQISGYVPEAEMMPTDYDANTKPRPMPVVKNGMATGTTFGWLNGLKSYVRHQDLGDGMKEFSVMETTIIPYSGRHGAFSAKGDSGSTILDRTGRVVGLITSGAGLNGEIEVTFATPAYEL